MIKESPRNKSTTLSIIEQKILESAIYHWRIDCVAVNIHNRDETISQIYRQSIVDANTPYEPKPLEKAFKRNEAHKREIEIQNLAKSLKTTWINKGWI